MPDESKPAVPDATSTEKTTPPAVPGAPDDRAQGGSATGDVEKLTGALQHERDQHKATKVRLAALESSQAEATRAAAEAEQQRLASQGEYKTLAEQRQAELDTANSELARLRSIEAEATASAETLKAYAEADIKALGLDKQPAIMELLTPLKPKDQLDWLARHKATLKPGMRSLPETPSEDGDKKLSAEEKRQRAVPITRYGA